MSKVQSETGRIYTFIEYDSWKGGTSFSPTQMKNYETQGTATGDIVPMMLGVLARTLITNVVLKDKALLVNTVHDSVILDVHPEVFDKALQVCYHVLSNASEEYEARFGYKFSLPLGIDIKIGSNWAEMKKYVFVK
jgi:DNA polymerase I-like protein with 3'-5' exonuclease and polymerase domains